MGRDGAELDGGMDGLEGKEGKAKKGKGEERNLKRKTKNENEKPSVQKKQIS